METKAVLLPRRGRPQKVRGKSYCVDTDSANSCIYVRECTTMIAVARFDYDDKKGQHSTVMLCIALAHSLTLDDRARGIRYGK